MSDLFNNVKPGDVVHYKTPQGQHGKGKVVLRYDTHVVVNRGKGQPQVVNDNNYVKHERGGKVIGALLSRLAKEEVGYNPKTGGVHPYDWDPVARADVRTQLKRAIKAQKGPKDTGTYKSNYKGPPPRAGTKSLPGNAVAIPEDAKDLEGKGSRVAKTKKHKKRLVAEVSKPLRKRYIKAATKDIANSESEAMKHGNSEHGNRMYAKAKKRYDGITKAMKEDVVNEVSAPGKEAWIKANKARFIAKYGKEKGTKILYAKAWKDSKQNEARESEWSANIHMAQGAGKINKPAKGHYLMRDGRRLSGPHSPEEAVKQYKGMSDSKGVKIVHVKEALSADKEWYRLKDTVKFPPSKPDADGNFKMGSSLGKDAAGYFNKDGHFVSKGSVWTGIKKKHLRKVNEYVEVDVTSMLMEATKVKKAAEKAISLAKKAKGNKHVDTEPKLDIQDKGTGGPMETNQEGENHAKL